MPFKCPSAPNDFVLHTSANESSLYRVKFSNKSVIVTDIIHKGVWERTGGGASLLKQETIIIDGSPSWAKLG